MRIGVVFDEQMLLHRKHRVFHVERPERIMAIYLNLIKKDLLSQLVELDSDEAAEADILLAHKATHIRHVKCDGEKLSAKQNYMPNADTYMNKHTAQAALVSCGSTVEAVSAVCSQMQVDQAFAIVRPPGHHAHNDIVAGFCMFNNVGVAARVA